MTPLRAGWYAAPGRPTKSGEIRPVARCGSCGDMVPPGVPLRRLISGALRCAVCADRILGEQPPAELIAAEPPPSLDAPKAQPTITPPPAVRDDRDVRQRQTGEDDA
jgi:hypothetical protein